MRFTFGACHGHPVDRRTASRDEQRLRLHHHRPRRPAARDRPADLEADGTDAGGVHRRDAAHHLVPGGPLHAAAEPGGEPAPLRQLPRHRPRARPALGEPVLQQDQGLGPRAQLQQREAEGQRPARQPDRDRRDGRLAGRRHGARELRRRELRGLRADAGRVGAAPPGAQLRIRQPRRSGRDDEPFRGHAALGHRRGVGRAQPRAAAALRTGRPGRRRRQAHPPRVRTGGRRNDAAPPAGGSGRSRRAARSSRERSAWSSSR